jgi:hypothetical protein
MLFGSPTRSVLEERKARAAAQKEWYCIYDGKHEHIPPASPCFFLTAAMEELWEYDCGVWRRVSKYFQPRTSTRRWIAVYHSAWARIALVHINQPRGGACLENYFISFGHHASHSPRTPSQRAQMCVH